MPGSIMTGKWKPTTFGTTGTDPMKDNISKTLSQLRKGQKITVIYDGSLEQERKQITGTVANIDNYWEILQINNIGIDFSEIYAIFL